MKKFYKFLGALAISSFIFPSLVFAFSVNQFQYISEIEMPELNEASPVRLPITQEVRQAASIYDLRIASTIGDEIPYAILTENKGSLASIISVTEVSSTRAAALGETFEASNMLDGDTETFFEADYQIDNGNSYFIIDLGEKQFTNELSLTPADSSKNWDFLKIDLSDDGYLWREAVSLSRPQTTIDYPETLAQYIRVTLTYSDDSLTISELDLTGTTEAKLLFEAEPNTTYSLYYGSIVSSETDYDTDHLYTTIDTQTATLGPGMNNTDYNIDFDLDGFPNVIDNCPFIASDNQDDSDNDSLGDVCDNAPEDPNKTQLDYDEDGLGNDADNCPLHANPDQLDKDLDEIGWVCDDEDNDGIINSEDNCPDVNNESQSDVDGDGDGDECDDQDDQSTERAQWLLWAVIGLGAAVLILISYRIIQKK